MPWLYNLAERLRLSAPVQKLEFPTSGSTTYLGGEARRSMCDSERGDSHTHKGSLYGILFTLPNGLHKYIDSSIIISHASGGLPRNKRTSAMEIRLNSENRSVNQLS